VSSAPEVRYARAISAPIDDFIAAFSRIGGQVHRGEGGVDEAIAGRAPVAFADDRPSRDALAVAEVGVVHATAGVAATGSIVVDARRVRSASLLPPACVFILRTADIVATPGDVLRHRQRWWPDGPPSQIVFVTGPSRSGDIELQLLTGVHGPGEVHAVLIDD
jgi:L-lactate dehydrogenase complex protein LldG